MTTATTEGRLSGRLGTSMAAMFIFALWVSAAEGIALLIGAAFDLSGNAKLALSLSSLVVAVVVGIVVLKRYDRRGCEQSFS
ncbi:hypothetical protein [Candidatus Poriferisocius sp.]|uniref:hypothetical protein n=1 Tax=Candidatus Poriferisocius sp. TaxID=3101276 RepID=UPI003B51A2A5